MTSSEAGRFDAIVIGGGHNGLACAAALGRTGRKVLVLEAADRLGGAAGTHEFAPGFRVSSLAHILNRLHPEMVAGLDLRKHGLALSAGAIPSVALSSAGDPLVLDGAYGERLDGTIDAADRSGWSELRSLLFRQAGILKPFLSRRPPDLGAMSLGQASLLGSAALSLRRLGKEEMREFLRMVLMNVADVLDEHVGDDRLKGLVAFDATLGAHLGPRSPTSLLGLYYRLAGEVAGVTGAQALPKGGMGAVAAALARAAEAAGCKLRPSAVVGRIMVEKGRACGVTLDDGEEIRARTVVSAINPVTTFLDLVGPRHVDTGFVRRLGHIRMKGDAAKLHLALDAPPRFAGLAEEAHRGRLVIAPSVDHVEKAFNPAKYGAYSPEPVMEITLPSLGDPSLAPAGACVLSAVVQFAPYALKQGWEAGKPKFLAAIMAVLECHAPGIGRSVQHAELLTPADIEARFRMPGGHWHHGEMQVDQMLMNRPVHGADGYDTPLDGLFLAGAGSHPGGGISGAPGWNAAKRVVEVRG
ncbi:NAD(P)/FAD-dependent oxidoreductase [Aquibium sp. ELW1220]|uniref:phytoene desaturase family protein n=1 Tax=Aquibium sp. ELW1220 TaxID=2976766 RepID=UPI0025B08DE2|nr:NAD(P)/FAD-dependent oxidoreductase [Aquibium sp. ELW1220]MDN2579670.1 NAD(P)/FAD-dependent oxidoreductase [Aquibium sp. ELW1220]